MPNQITAEGLELFTREEWTAFWTEKYQAIYGTDINLASDTPDGQFIGICVQVSLDGGDLTRQVYNSFDPDNAIGVVLDQRISINGIQRQAGTYSITPIELIVTQPINLYGLDQVSGLDPQPVYTVRDNEGNRWYLIETEEGILPGTYVYNFRAAVPGAVLTTPNTITTQVTIVLGVQSVNNPSAQSLVGLNEESDPQVKVRRQKSVAQASQGYLAGLYAALNNISGMTSVFVYENDTDATDSDGVPSHSIWVIVAGTAEPADIADAIYRKRNAGCGMYGDQTYNVERPAPQAPLTVRWDDVITRALFIKFTASSIDGATAPNIPAIRPGLVTDYVPGVFEPVDINGLATVVQDIDPNTLVTNAGFSTGDVQEAVFSGVAASGTFKLSYGGIETAAINWNDAVGTIQTKVQAIPALAAVTVTGSIASQSLIFDLSSLSDVIELLTATANSLATSGPAAITISVDAVYTPTLAPPTKQNQFRITEANIYILAMQLLPVASTVATTTGTVQFVGYGGYGDYTYSIQTNNTGGSINSTSGLYTAGALAGTDTIKVTDAMGNTATATATAV